MFWPKKVERVLPEVSPLLVPYDNEKSWNKVKDLYGIYRAYTTHEDDLINHRTTWHNVIQGALFGAGAAIYRWPIPTDDLNPIMALIIQLALPLIIGGAGIAIAYFGWLSIHAANLAIEDLRLRWERAAKHFPDYDHLPPLTGGGAPNAEEYGLRPAIAIPVVVIIAWIFILGFSCTSKILAYCHQQASMSQHFTDQDHSVSRFLK
jgi:hypothetical protein